MTVGFESDFTVDHEICCNVNLIFDAALPIQRFIDHFISDILTFSNSLMSTAGTFTTAL